MKHDKCQSMHCLQQATAYRVSILRWTDSFSRRGCRQCRVTPATGEAAGSVLSHCLWKPTNRILYIYAIYVYMYKWSPLSSVVMFLLSIPDNTISFPRSFSLIYYAYHMKQPLHLEFEETHLSYTVGFPVWLQPSVALGRRPVDLSKSRTGLLAL